MTATTPEARFTIRTQHIGERDWTLWKGEHSSRKAAYMRLGRVMGEGLWKYGQVVWGDRVVAEMVSK
jgi:hypothetical protein